MCPEICAQAEAHYVNAKHINNPCQLVNLLRIQELRFIYDKAIEETAVDLMPFIESQYPVKTGRENTAIAGVSEGGAKSLCTGFTWLDKFGYIGGFAPDTGVIPTEYFKGTFWNTPVPTLNSLSTAFA